MLTKQQPKISLIVAMDKQRGMGFQNQLPWHLPADLAYFKQQTLGKPVIMGRKTFESIGRVLPRRKNIVLSQSGFMHQDVMVVQDVAAALKAVGDEPEVMVIGGAGVYQTFLSHAHTIYLTEVDGIFEADVFFPNLIPTQWQRTLIKYLPKDNHNAFDLNFYRLDRRE